MSKPVPVARGNLEKTPFIHMLVHISLRRLSGTLAMWPAASEASSSGQDRILFADGMIVGARLREPATSLRAGLLPVFRRTEGTYGFYEANLIGTEGILAETIDPYGLIAASLRGAALEAPIDRVLQSLGDHPLRMRSDVDLSRFQFETKEVQFLDLIRAAPSSATTLMHLWKNDRQSRRLLYLLAITRTVEPYGAPVRPAKPAPPPPPPTPTASRQRPTVPPPPTPRALASSQPPGLSTPPPLFESPEQSDPYALHQVNLPSSEPPPNRRSSAVDLASPIAWPDSEPVPHQSSGRAAAAVSSPFPPRADDSVRSPSFPPASPREDTPPPAPPPPEPLSPELRVRWNEIAIRAVHVDQENYYQMLGMDPRSSRETIHNAYLELVKHWHPDRLPPELASIRPWAERVFGHLTEAHDTLMDEKKRAEYTKAVQAGGGTPASDRHVHSVVEAAIEFRKVEVFEKRRAWDEALDSLHAALRLHYEEADFHAMKAWLLFQKLGLKGPHETEIEASLSRAFALDADCERAHYTRGILYKLQGRPEQALFHFRRVAQNNPKHIEAAREVRLATMRGHSPSSRPPPPNPSGGGLLKKLFSKK